MDIDKLKGDRYKKKDMSERREISIQKRVKEIESDRLVRNVRVIIGAKLEHHFKGDILKIHPKVFRYLGILL